MKILVAGLSQQSACAVELIAGSVFTKPTYVRLVREITSALPVQTAEAIACDICVFDLLGLGLARWTSERETELHGLLASRPSIILVPPGGGGGWLPAMQQTKSESNRIVLQHPASAASLFEALNKIRQDSQQTSTPASQKIQQNEPLITRERGTGRYGAPAVPDASIRTLTERSSIAKSSSFAGSKLVDGGYSALLMACPDVEKNLFLNLICSIVMKRVVHELRVTEQTGAVIHPVENWVSSNISTVFRNRLTQYSMMMKIIKVEQPSEADARKNAQRLYGRRADGRRPLDAFVWSQVFTTFEKIPLVAVGDLNISLHQFPNFTRLPKAPDVFLQLALVCMRQPQSIFGLKKMFVRHDPNLISLFVACVVLSGMATVLESRPPVPDKVLSVSTTLTAPEAQVRRGFFKSLLDKLF